MARVLLNPAPMSDGLYIGMTGAVARAEQLDAIADNLANAHTAGFKAARPAFESFLAPGAQPTDKAAVAAVASGIDLRPGPTQRTGAPLDATPEEGAFFAVRTAQGKVAFTRDGRLSVDADGAVRAAGHHLLSKRGEPIRVPPGAAVTLNPDGMVLAAGVEIDRVALFQLQGNVERAGPSLLSPTAGGAAQASDAKLRLGEIELGNASPLEAAVQMVTAQRHYESSMQAIETYKKLGDRANELGRVR